MRPWAVLAWLRLRPATCARAATAAAPGTAAHAEQERKVAWNDAWNRCRWWEGVATVGFWVTTSALDSRIHPPSTPNWSGPILLDKPARELFRGRSVHVEYVAGKYSDTLLQ